MLLNRRDGMSMDLAQYASLRWHLATPECHIAEIVGQLNDGLYDHVPAYGTVIDLGANCGLFSAYVSAMCNRVIAVEPSPRHFTVLENFVQEALLTNVTPVNAAIWGYNGFVKFQEDQFNATMDRIEYHSLTSGMTMAMRLDTLFQAYRIERADFVKMDIEGAEEAVLGGYGFTCASPKIDCLWVECHNYMHWDDGKEVGDRVECLVSRHFPRVERVHQDLVIGRR